MDDKQVRSLCRKVTELLETEEWVLSFADSGDGKVSAHSMAGRLKPELLAKMIERLWVKREALLEAARKNFP